MARATGNYYIRSTAVMLYNRGYFLFGSFDTAGKGLGMRPRHILFTYEMGFCITF